MNTCQLKSEYSKRLDSQVSDKQTQEELVRIKFKFSLNNLNKMKLV